MGKTSAGILVWRRAGDRIEVLLVHPGGPFFAKKDAGVWSIPKGEQEGGDDLLSTARREFEEELGMRIEGHFVPLQPVKQKGGKQVYAWAVESDIDTAAVRSNSFTIEWPPRSGKMSEFPEVDKVAWLSMDEATVKINAAQVALLEELRTVLNADTDGQPK